MSASWSFNTARASPAVKMIWSSFFEPFDVADVYNSSTFFSSVASSPRPQAWPVILSFFDGYACWSFLTASSILDGLEDEMMTSAPCSTDASATQNPMPVSQVRNAFLVINHVHTGRTANYKDTLACKLGGILLLV